MPEAKIKEKSWSKELEKEAYSKWKEGKLYAFDKNSKKKVYSIDTPPPYVNTPVHIGQATTYVLMDMFARYRRMKGFNVLFPLGLDRNGLPIEMAAEKKFNVKLTETARETFIEYCREVLEASSLESTDSFLQLGISFNSWELGKEIGNVYHTDSDDYRQLTQETFIDMWHKGLIYEDERINNFCPGCQTTLADAEVSYADISSMFNDIIFTVKETGEKIIIGTTRPELVCTCGMVIFNPEDGRYKELDGKHAVTPLFNREVPIKAHPLAEIDKGTGLAMMCSAGDLSDIRFFREMGLVPVIAINKDGTMNEHAGFLKGLKVKEARKAMIEKLKEEGLLVKQTPIIHKTPICDRSKHEIEFISMREYYVKQLDSKDKMRELAAKVHFYAPESRKILLDWIDAVSIDWPITRRRYYATEVPLWYCRKCGEVIVPAKGRYYKPWKENPPVAKCPKCGSTEFKGDERVFDTWFDSSISPLYILKYSRDENFFEKNSPCTLRPQGKEIIRTWLYYTLLKCYLLTGKCIFQDAWINYHIVDEKGKKMSKSLGNGIDPKDVLAKFGAEPFRLWAAVEGNLERDDFRCSFDRIDGAGKTIVKLWNVAKFISMFELDKKVKPSLHELDKWILSELNKMVELANESYENYNFHEPAIQIKHFIWETFASHYMELVKNRAYNQEGKYSPEDQQAAVSTLYNCLETILKLLAPVMPMLCYKLSMDIFGKDVHFEEFPKAGKEYKPPFTTDELLALDSAIWKAKRDKALSLKAEVKEAVLPEQFRAIEKDLCSTHGIKHVEYGKELSVDL
ncbi:MAG TPA: valine--tRNA ligase [Nanoarchaeota archaeon]|nr:valine--tRNA ligase [Nanoarchaeota archaeon]